MAASTQDVAGSVDVNAPRTGSGPTPLRLAVVGCGAVAKANLLPVLAGHDAVRLAVLVDRDLGRARELASSYGIGRTATDLDAVVDDVDAVVLATPPAHHAPATQALAARGKHVFVEKPMAVTLADADAMVAAADRHGVALAVGLYRRVLPAVRLMRALLERGEYGRPVAIDAEEGGPYGWQLASLDGLTKAAGGGGVLIDIGSHVIDVVLHMVPGTPRLARFEDNARGGIETDCVAHVDLATGGGTIPWRLELSRTRELRGSIRIRCERATLELLRGNFTEVLVHPNDGDADSPFRITASWKGQVPYIGYQAFRDELDDWIGAVQQGTSPLLSGRSVLPVVGLIEQCYATRRPIEEPWTDEGLHPEQRPARTSKRGRVLVTGAGGFLGARTVELLRERHGWDVVALVREPKSAARLVQWPQQIRLGDVCSRADMDRALEGCDAVVHCAVGTSWKPEETRRVTVDGTRVVAEAALAAGVSRFVHISTMFVHRRDRGDVVDESTPLEPPIADRYAQNKLAAEQALAQVASRGLSTVILRPARIYGPFSKTFTVRPLQAIADGTFAIRGNPEVPANMVYVDNVVHAVACALDAPAAANGGAFLVSEPDQLSLEAFYAYFAAAAGRPIRVVPEQPGVTRPAPTLMGRWIGGLKTIALAPEVRALVHRVMDTDPVGTLPRRLWEASPAMQARLLKLFRVDAAVTYRPAPSAGAADLLYYGDPGLVSAARAERDLKYAAAVPPARAMALTLDWAMYARLLTRGTTTT
ncbi:MAG: Gfo/Idh/MocA family oxidoreductase [Acidobacteria bacterium]|nr:Gfo/Idh/MocA family oxidoreductase [Acidobacteriota bacterium]